MAHGAPTISLPRDGERIDSALVRPAPYFHGHLATAAEKLALRSSDAADTGRFLVCFTHGSPDRLSLHYIAPGPAAIVQQAPIECRVLPDTNALSLSVSVLDTADVPASVTLTASSLDELVQRLCAECAHIVGNVVPSSRFVRASEAGIIESLTAGDDGPPEVLLASGSNAGGMLGVGAGVTHAITPVRVPAFSLLRSPATRVTSIAVGDAHVLACTSIGCAYAWGSNTSAQCGIGVRGGRLFSPTLIPALSGHICVAVSAGASHSLVLTLSADVFVFGDNTAGQCVPGHAHARTRTPVSLAFFNRHPFQRRHVHNATRSPARVYAHTPLFTPMASSRILIDDTEDAADDARTHTHASTFRTYHTHTSVVDASAHDHTVEAALLASLKKRSRRTDEDTAGADETGVAMDDDAAYARTYTDAPPDSSAAPTDATPVKRSREDADAEMEVVTAVTAGGDTSFAVTHTGRVYVWGSHRGGVSGLGLSNGSCEQPFLIASLSQSRVQQVVCSGAHTLFLCEDGGVYACGSGLYGRLGLGDTRDRMEPARVRELDRAHITCVAVGRDHSLAVTHTGEVFAWGSNTHAQTIPHDTTPVDLNVSVPSTHTDLDDDSSATPSYVHPAPTCVASLSRVSMGFAAAGASHSMCVSDDGDVWVAGAAPCLATCNGATVYAAVRGYERQPGEGGHMCVCPTGDAAPCIHALTVKQVEAPVYTVVPALTRKQVHGDSREVFRCTRIVTNGDVAFFSCACVTTENDDSSDMNPAPVQLDAEVLEVADLAHANALPSVASLSFQHALVCVSAAAPAQVWSTFAAPSEAPTAVTLQPVETVVEHADVAIAQVEPDTIVALGAPLAIGEAAGGAGADVPASADVASPPVDSTPGIVDVVPTGAEPATPRTPPKEEAAVVNSSPLVDVPLGANSPIQPNEMTLQFHDSPAEEVKPAVDADTSRRASLQTPPKPRHLLTATGARAPTRPPAAPAAIPAPAVQPQSGWARFWAMLCSCSCTSAAAAAADVPGPAPR